MGRPPGSKNRVPGRPRGPGRPIGRPPGRPPGRPRRYSNSTVASVDLGHVAYLEETTVLKPLQNLDHDDWPIFVLLDAVIYRKTENGQLEQANACNVDLEGPFLIKGKLDVDLTEAAQAHSLQDYAQKAAYVEIPSSSMYSVGWVNDTEEAVIWSAGKSGWFEICPASEYRAMYDTVCEGVTLYYLLQQIYEDARDRAGKGKRSKALLMPIEELLKQYAIRLGDGLTLSEAKERCRKHAPFLLAHFARDETINWKATSFHKWMTDTNPMLSDKLKEAEEARKNFTEPEPSARQSNHQSYSVRPKAEPEDDAHLLSRITPAESDRSRRTRERATRLSHESDIEMKDAPSAQAPTRIETPILPPPVPLRAAPAPAAVPTPTTPAARHAQEVPEAPSDPVRAFLELLEEIFEEGAEMSKLTPARIHSRMYIKCSTVYQAPREVSLFYAKQLAASLPSKWYTTPYFKWLVEERNKPWKPELVNRDTVALQLRRRKRMTQLSRPRPREADGTSTPHMGKRLPVTPRTGALTLKRPRPSYYQDDEDGQPSKHARALGHSDEENSEDEQLNDSSDAAPARSYPYSTTPIPPPRIPKEIVPIVVRAEKIPTVSPAGPNGTWRCDEDGCGYVVRSAEEPEGKLLIDEHFQNHANRVEKVNLALAEGTRGNMPINHLLDKIRSMGEAARKREQGADGAFPDAIKRRLIV